MQEEDTVSLHVSVSFTGFLAVDKRLPDIKKKEKKRGMQNISQCDRKNNTHFFFQWQIYLVLRIHSYSLRTYPLLGLHNVMYKTCQRASVCVCPVA